MLVALVFVLARNIVKLVVERRGGLPFARFRAKLVALLLGHDARAGRAGAGGRQRADWPQRRAVVQRADGRDSVVGESDRRRLLPGTSAARRGPGDAHCPDAGDRRSDESRRGAAARADRPGRHVAARADGRGVSGRHRTSAVCRGSSRCSTLRRRRCRPATRGRPPSVWPRRRWPARRRRDRSKRSARRAICCTPRRSSARKATAMPTGVVVATDYLTGDLAARSRRMTKAFERLQPAARAEASADRRVPVVLPDGHADDSGRRHLDGAVSRQADHAPGADARRGGARDRRRTPRSASRTAERRRVRRADGGLQHDGRRAGDEPAQGRAIDDRARAQASRGRTPPPLHRDDPRAHHDRRRFARRGRDRDDDQQRGAPSA